MEATTFTMGGVESIQVGDLGYAIVPFSGDSFTIGEAVTFGGVKVPGGFGGLELDDAHELSLMDYSGSLRWFIVQASEASHHRCEDPR